MAARGDLRELIGEPCRNALGGVLLPSCRDGDGICRDEADAVDLLRETVGRLLHHLDCKRTVRLEDARSICTRDAVLLEPEHDVPELGLPHIGGDDLLHGLRADARDLSQSARRALDDLQCLRAESLHNAPRHRGANAVDRT